MTFRSLLLPLFPFAAFAAEPIAVNFDQWVFPEHSWKEEDFKNRFLGRYGVNGFTEPQMDVENFNLYQGAMAVIEDKAQTIAFLTNGIENLDKSGIQASAALHFVLGSIYYEEGDKPSAIDQYINAIRKHPSFLRAYANLGFTLMELGETEKALPVLLKAVELGANESQIHGLIGRIYTEKKLFDSGLTAFRAAIMFSPENNAWRYGALQSLIGLGRFQDAIALADEAVAFDRRNAANWKNRAGLLVRLERWDDAIIDLQTAHALGGATFDTHLNLAVLYFNKGIYEQAARALGDATLLAKDDSEFERLLQRIQSVATANRLDEALALLPAVETRASQTQVEIDRAKIDYIRAMGLLNDQAYEAALALLEPLFEARPADGDLHLMAARAHAALGRQDDAKLAFQIAATIDETSYQANYEHARLELSRGQIPAALKLLRAAYSKRPSEELRAHLRELEAYAEN